MHMILCSRAKQPIVEEIISGSYKVIRTLLIEAKIKVDNKAPSSDNKS